MNPHIACLMEHPDVVDVRELAKEYDVLIGEVSVNVRVYVFPYTGKYLAITDHGVQREGQAAPYRRMEHQDTPEAALADAVTGLLEVYEPGEGRGCLIKIE